MKSRLFISALFIFSVVSVFSQIPELKPEILRYEPFIWKDEVPEDCPFKQSEVLYAVKFLGVKSGYHYGDTWCPTWASNDTLYYPWTPPPHTPEKPIFGETGMYGNPVKIGAPHFVDFGKNMEHSPDGKAYLVAHGADLASTKNNWRFWNTSWITGDHIYLLRVTPGAETINDASKYEFYGGKDKNGIPVWTSKFEDIKPLLDWNNNMGCVTVTYNPLLKKYIMCVTDGGTKVSKMNTYLLESDKIDGDWKIITYMKEFGTQAYFVSIPSKFISADGITMWLLYSGNSSLDENDKPHKVNPPGGHYGITFQKIQLITGS